jgi:hypothetical protein
MRDLRLKIRSWRGLLRILSGLGQAVQFQHKPQEGDTGSASGNAGNQGKPGEAIDDEQCGRDDTGAGEQGEIGAQVDAGHLA